MRVSVKSQKQSLRSFAYKEISSKKLNVKTLNEKLPISNSLFSTCNKYGIAAFAIDSGVFLYETHTLVQCLKENLLDQEKSLLFVPIQNSISIGFSNESLMIANTIAVYSIQISMIKQYKTKIDINATKIYSVDEPNRIRMIKVHSSGVYAVHLSSDLLQIFDSNGSLKFAKENVSCSCWVPQEMIMMIFDSEMCQVLAIDLKNASQELTRHSFDTGQPFSVYGMECLNQNLISLGIYSSFDGEDGAFVATLDTASSEIILYRDYSTFFDDHTKDDFYYFFAPLDKNWSGSNESFSSFCSVCSTLSSDLECFGILGGNFSSFELEEGSSVVFPLNEDSEGIKIVGMALDFTSEVLIKHGEDEFPPAPILWIYMQDASILCYTLFKSDSTSKYQDLSPASSIPENTILNALDDSNAFITHNIEPSVAKTDISKTQKSETVLSAASLPIIKKSTANIVQTNYASTAKESVVKDATNFQTNDADSNVLKQLAPQQQAIVSEQIPIFPEDEIKREIQGIASKNMANSLPYIIAIITSGFKESIENIRVKSNLLFRIKDLICSQSHILNSKTNIQELHKFIEGAEMDFKSLFLLFKETKDFIENSSKIKCVSPRQKNSFSFDEDGFIVDEEMDSEGLTTESLQTLFSKIKLDPKVAEDDLISSLSALKVTKTSVASIPATSTLFKHKSDETNSSNVSVAVSNEKAQDYSGSKIEKNNHSVTSQSFAGFSFFPPNAQSASGIQMNTVLPFSSEKNIETPINIVKPTSEQLKQTKNVPPSKSFKIPGTAPFQFTDANMKTESKDPQPFSTAAKESAPNVADTVLLKDQNTSSDTTHSIESAELDSKSSNAPQKDKEPESLVSEQMQDNVKSPSNEGNDSLSSLTGELMSTIASENSISSAPPPANMSDSNTSLVSSASSSTSTFGTVGASSIKTEPVFVNPFASTSFGSSCNLGNTGVLSTNSFALKTQSSLDKTGAASSLASNASSKSSSNPFFGAPSAPFSPSGAFNQPSPMSGASNVSSASFGSSEPPKSAFGTPSVPYSAFGVLTTPTSSFGSSSAPSMAAFGTSSMPTSAFGTPSAPMSTFGASPLANPSLFNSPTKPPQAFVFGMGNNASANNNSPFKAPSTGFLGDDKKNGGIFVAGAATPSPFSMLTAGAGDNPLLNATNSSSVLPTDSSKQNEQGSKNLPSSFTNFR